MAVFCDFENVALGVRDAKIDRFDIKPVLERLLLKGSIVVKKAYCDWDRYKAFKASMHEASFELIEIPHVRQSGKNSADIRLVVDALDLCYTKSHVDTFVIVSGDSDFSPLVSKLRENAKKVIGVGVKNSTSDLLVANCDEFIFYDDLVREQQRNAKRENGAPAKRPAGEERQPKPENDERKSKAIALAVETLDALVSERGESGKIWASVLKSAIKRRRPDFSETRYGFRAFGNLLDEAQARGLIEVGRDEKSGAYVTRTAQASSTKAAVESSGAETVSQTSAEDDTRGRRKGRRNERRPDGSANRRNVQEAHHEAPVATPHGAFEGDDDAQPAASEERPQHAFTFEAVESVESSETAVATEPATAPRRARKSPSRKSTKRKPAAEPVAASAPEPVAEAVAEPVAEPKAKKAAAKKAAPRARRPRSKAAADET